MHFRCTAKSAMGIAGRAVLALALAIGVSGAIFGVGWLQSAPFFTPDEQIENTDVAADRADSTNADLRNSDQSTGAVSIQSRLRAIRFWNHKPEDSPQRRRERRAGAEKIIHNLCAFSAFSAPLR